MAHREDLIEAVKAEDMDGVDKILARFPHHAQYHSAHVGHHTHHHSNQPQEHDSAQRNERGVPPAHSQDTAQHSAHNAAKHTFTDDYSCIRNALIWIAKKENDYIILNLIGSLELFNANIKHKHAVLKEVLMISAECGQLGNI